MPSLAQLRMEHRELERLAAQLLRIVVADVPDSALVAGIRWQIARALHQHCAREEHTLVAPLADSPDSLAAAAARRYRADEIDLCASFAAYIAAWPVSRIAGEWTAFRSQTLTIATTIADRIHVEEQLLYPHAQRLAERRAA